MSATTNRYRLHIDWTKCDGRGLCTELLPKLLGRDEWGYPEPLNAGGDRSNVPVPTTSMEAADDAVSLCPLVALSLLPPDTQR